MSGSKYRLILLIVCTVGLISAASSGCAFGGEGKPNGPPAQPGSVPGPVQITQELQQEYLALLQDVDDMRYFSSFSTPEAIAEDELILFGYRKAGQRGLSGSASRAEITWHCQKYFERSVEKQASTALFVYDETQDVYQPAGWSISGAQPHFLQELIENQDGSLTARFDVYLFSEQALIDQQGIPADPTRISSEIEKIEAKAQFKLLEKDGQPYLCFLAYERYGENTGQTVPEVIAREPVPPVAWEASKQLRDEEFTVWGVRLGMTYAEVLGILGGFDEIVDNANVRSLFKDGFHYGFYESDGVYRLLSVTLQSPSAQEFPRGLKIGDSIETVFAKFPCQDAKLKQWAVQVLYGRDEAGVPRAILQFTIALDAYRIYATTTEQVLIIEFDKQNKVKSLELHKEKG